MPKCKIIFPHTASLNVKIEGFDVYLELSDSNVLTRVNRKPSNLPFKDDSLEAAAGSVKLTVNGEEMSVIVPPVGMSGGLFGDGNLFEMKF